MAGKPQQPQAEPTQDARRDIELSKFKGMNTSGSPFSIPDDEFQWLEELLPVSGTLQQPPGPGAVISTLPAPVSKMWAYTIGSTPFLCCACTNNKLYFVNLTTNAIVTSAAITSPTQCDVTVWQGTEILVISGNGYQSFNGTAVTSISTSVTGSVITVFSSRVWIGSGRTITFTAPGSYTDFTVADAAGSFIISDSAFIGNVTALYSALEQLWIFGQNAINVLSNVTVVSSTSTTVFSNANLSNVEGCNWQRAIAPQLRSLTFANPNGIYMMTGLTPQKISDQLNGMFQNTNPSFTVHAGVASVFSSQWLCYLVQYTGNNGAGAGPIILMLDQKNGWGISRQGGNLSAIATAWVNGLPVLYGANGANVFPLFSGPSAVSNWSLTTKLFDMNQASTSKEIYRIGAFISQGAGGLANLNAITENGSQPLSHLNTQSGVNFYAAGVRGFGRGIGISMSGTGYGTVIYSLSLQAQPRTKW
jgi:hypothetical protein